MTDFLSTSAEVAGIAAAVKMIVDVIKAYSGGDLQPWILPMAALAIGLALSFLYIAAQPETVWTLATVSSATLRGVFGGIGAVSVTEVHKMARGQR
jgi:uncharacterized membrane protein HdeD (DUF308 family)